MAWDPKDYDFQSIKGMDPAANWLLGAAAADYLPDGASTPVPFFLKLADSSAVEAFENLPPFRDGADSNGALVLDFGAINSIVPQKFLPIFASREWFIRLLKREFRAFREANKRIVLSSPVTLPKELLVSFPDFPRTLSFVGARLNPPPGGWPTGTVLTAVIDDGIAFAHDRFREASDKTRIQCFYDMNQLADHLVKSEIDDDLSKLDEDAIYQRRGLIDYTNLRHKTAAWRAAHGTHVLDLAAGYAPSKALPEDMAKRPIIAVQLPTFAVELTTGELLDFFLGAGLLYILHQANNLAEVGKPLPLVINISLGYVAEQRHFGGVLEELMDLLVQLRPKTQIVLPAGNSHLARGHAVIDFSEDDEVEFDWIVQPDDKTHSWFVVLLPPGERDGNRMKLTVTRPDKVIETIDEATVLPKLMRDDVGLMEVYTDADGQRRFYIWIRPTERPQPDPRAIAPAGRWKLKFEKGPAEMVGVAHAWVQRDESLVGYPQRGRQSYFDHPNYRRFDDRTFLIETDAPAKYGPCPVMRKSLLNAAATGKHVATAGGFIESGCRVAPYSAGGPIVPPEDAALRKPDVLLPSEGSKAHAGVLAAGSRSGSVVAISGTSMAAPQLVRHIANLLETGTATRADVKILAQAGDVCTTVPKPDREGWGRLSRDDPREVERIER